MGLISVKSAVLDSQANRIKSDFLGIYSHSPFK